MVLSTQNVTVLCVVAAVSAEGERSQVLFSFHAGSSSYCEVEVQDIDEESEWPKISGNTNDMCQQFSSELKKKFQVGKH